MKKVAYLSLLLLGACSLVPELKLPDIELPSSWNNAPEQTGEIEAPKPLDTSWWEQFNSKQLPTLITKAQTANPDLEAALARIAQARAQQRIAGSSLWPSLSADGSIGRDYNSRGGTGGKSSAETGYSAGFVASYELDLFGKNSSTEKAAAAQTQATVYDHQALLLSISAQTALGYIDLLALNARVELAQKNLANARDVLSVIRIRRDSGALSALEFAQQENFVGSSEASLAALKQQQEAARNSLAILLGVTPESQAVFTESLSELTAPAVPVSMPASVLAQRPDIASAEASLVAANFNIGAARAAFYPSLSIDGRAAIGATPLSSPSASIASLAANIAAPLFTGGALEGGYENATARQQELAASYRKTVLAAFADVETTLSDVQKQQQRVTALTKAAAAAKTAYDTSMVRFNAGAIDSITLLDAQRSVLSSQDAMVAAQADQLAATIALYRAMGGGWKKE